MEGEMNRKEAFEKALEKWRQDVGSRRDETQWFYEQAKANECARIILAEELQRAMNLLSALGKKDGWSIRLSSRGFHRKRDSGYESTK